MMEESLMGMSTDHWVAEHEGHKIEVEAYKAGFMTAGCSLFVDDVRVDSVPHFEVFFSAFTLRHKFRDRERDVTICVQVNQRLTGTKAKLSIDGKPVDMKKDA
jgi:hypothetical protein